MGLTSLQVNHEKLIIPK